MEPVPEGRKRSHRGIGDVARVLSLDRAERVSETPSGKYPWNPILDTERLRMGRPAHASIRSASRLSHRILGCCVRQFTPTCWSSSLDQAGNLTPPRSSPYVTQLISAQQ